MNYFLLILIKICYGLSTILMAPGPITSWQIDGETMEPVTDFIFLGSKITADGECSHEIKTLAPWKKSYDKPRQHIKKQSHCFADKRSYSQSYGFSSSHIWMWEFDHKAGQVPKELMFLNCDGENSWESLDCKEIMSINPKGNESWIFIGRTDAEALILWPPDVKSWLIRKKPWWWERLKAGGEGDDRGWDGWMTSSTQWTWVWVNSGSCRWRGKPGMLQSMCSQKVRHDWVTELN